MILLRILWPIIASLMLLLLIVKVILVALAGNPILMPLVGLAFCFYLLFMLEGLQVAGLKIKDLDSDGIDQALHGNPDRQRKVSPVYKAFSGNFDGFVTGRQVFVIMTVVSLAFLMKQLAICQGAPAVGSGGEMSIVEWFKSLLINKPCEIPPTLAEKFGWQTGSTFVGFLDSAIFAFASATLIPAWISQLLPQFLADKRAISFICTPGARAVLGLAMFLDHIQLGQPAKELMRLSPGSRDSQADEHIPIGKSTFYEASLNFYGRGKKQHEISLILGEPTKVKEVVTYVFARGAAESLEHAIQLAAPVKGEIKGRIEMPANIHMEVQASDRSETGLYTYGLKFLLNQPLPRESVDVDEVVLVIEYETDAYVDESGVPQTAQFSSSLPTRSARVSIHGGDNLLRKPKVGIADLEGGLAEAGDTNIDVTTPSAGHNTSNIEIGHPMVGTVYQIEFETMGVSAGPQGS